LVVLVGFVVVTVLFALAATTVVEALVVLTWVL
jgi:hypothetical protein